MLDATAQLTPELFLAPGTFGRGSTRKTLLHLSSAQGSCRSCWNGSLPADEAIRLTVDHADFPDLTGLCSRPDADRDTR